MRTRRRTCQRGAVTLETSIALPLFLLLVFATMELLRGMYFGFASQFVLNRSLRESVVGPSAFGAASQRDYLIETIRARAHGYAIDLSSAEITICVSSSNGQSIDCSAEAEGGPGDLISVLLRIPLPLLLVGEYEIRSSGMARNELW